MFSLHVRLMERDPTYSESYTRKEPGVPQKQPIRLELRGTRSRYGVLARPVRRNDYILLYRTSVR